MKLFLISQHENKDYDTYDSAVVCAPDEETARNMDPGSGKPYPFSKRAFSAWAWSPDRVNVRYIGDALPSVPVGVVCASFNAG